MHRSGRGGLECHTVQNKTDTLRMETGMHMLRLRMKALSPVGSQKVDSKQEQQRAKRRFYQYHSSPKCGGHKKISAHTASRDREYVNSRFPNPTRAGERIQPAMHWLNMINGGKTRR